MIAKQLTKLLALATLGLASWLPSFAEEVADSPKERLEATITQLIDVLHQDNAAFADLAAKKQVILKLFDDSFPFDFIIRRALGRNWEKLSDDQKTQISDLISELLIQAYTKELRNGPKPRLTFFEAKPLSNTKIEIPSEVSYKNTHVNLTYRLVNLPERGWQVYDVLVEGVSMVTNYRKQFDEHFRSKTAADLISLLREKLSAEA